MLRELTVYLEVLLPAVLLTAVGAIGTWFWWQHHPHAMQPDSHWQETLADTPPASAAQSTVGRHDNNSTPLEADGVGRTYTGYYPMRGRMLPLQPGSWTVLAENVSQRPEASLWLRSDWSVVNISRYPEKVAYEKRLEEWGRDWWEKINSAAALPRL